MYTRKHLLLYYYKYKDSPYFSLCIFVCIFLVALLLLTKVVLPQMYTWFSINSEVEATRKRIDTINANIAYVNSLNQDDLAQKRTIFVRALPYEKDIQGILSIISSSAITSSIELEDFSLAIGELDPKSPDASLTSLNLQLLTKGSPIRLKNFIMNLQSRLPLVEVRNVQAGNDNGQITLTLYFKPIPTFKVDDAQPVQRISGKFNDLYATLSQWAANSDTSVSIPDPTISPTPRVKNISQ